MRDVKELTRSGGRRLAIHRLSQSSSGRVVLFCHPAPGSGDFDPDPAETAASDVTLLGVDRPGYGRSDAMTAGLWASVSSAADDLAAVAETMAERPVGLVGWSAGGRVALALAARRPELVDRVVVLGTPAPHEEVPWIPAEQAQILESLRSKPAAEVQATLAEQFAAILPADTGQPETLHLLGRSPADDEALHAPGATERLLGMMAGAFTQGATGLASDLAGYCLQPWGFEPEAVNVEALLLYGSADADVGPLHGRWWNEHLPSSQLEEVPGAGHFLILPMWRRVLSFLAQGDAGQRIEEAREEAAAYVIQRQPLEAGDIGDAEERIVEAAEEVQSETDPEQLEELAEEAETARDQIRSELYGRGSERIPDRD